MGSFEASPTVATHVAMVLWVPFCMVLVSALGATRGVIVGLIVGLFALPNTTYVFAGIPDYNKRMAIGFGVASAALLLDTRRVLSFRPAWVDLPVGILMVAPFVSAVHTGTGVWWGLSETFIVIVTWVVPWILGRLYVSTPAGLRFFAIAFVAAAIAYLPLCLFEIRMSPVLHEVVYGIKLKSFRHAPRAVGWRPNVFIEHGLMAAMILSMAALVAYWLWLTKTVQRVWGIPIGIACGALAVLTLATQSANAALMLFVGGAVLVASTQLRNPFPVLLLVLLPGVYIALRYFFEWRGDELVDAARAIFGERRATSFEARLDNEDLLTGRSKLRPWLGWSEIAVLKGRTGAITDAMWLILVGIWGCVGLAGAFGTMLAAPSLLWKRLPVRAWRHPSYAPLAVFGVVLALHAADSLLNSYPNPVFVAAGGGIACALGTAAGRVPWGLDGAR